MLQPCCFHSCAVWQLSCFILNKVFFFTTPQIGDSFWHWIGANGHWLTSAVMRRMPGNYFNNRCYRRGSSRALTLFSWIGFYPYSTIFTTNLLSDFILVDLESSVKSMLIFHINIVYINISFHIFIILSFTCSIFWYSLEGYPVVILVEKRDLKSLEIV